MGPAKTLFFNGFFDITEQAFDSKFLSRSGMDGLNYSSNDEEHGLQAVPPWSETVSETVPYFRPCFPVVSVLTRKKYF